MPTILHVDMDAFFASVEQRDDPRLAGRPVLVGGTAHRGVVAAASYEARKFGARSAMPMAEALRRCPQAVVVFPRRARYEEVSARVFEVFRSYTPLVEGLSLDEAFLDVTASESLFGDGPTMARKIKQEIAATVGLTASAGVASCKFAAKIASDLDKPNGLTVVGPDVAAFLAPLPIERMWGIGPKTAPNLRRLGYRTIGDLARAPVETLTSILGRRAAEVRGLARGIDPRPVEPQREARSISVECTYDEDLRTEKQIARTLFEHASKVAERLTDSDLLANAVVVKLKFADFSIATRRTTLDAPASDTKTIHAAALELLARFRLDGKRVRLTGVAAQDLVEPSAQQPTLFRDEASERRRRVEELRHSARAKFGGGSITFATLLDQGPSRQASNASLRHAPSPQDPDERQTTREPDDAARKRPRDGRPKHGAD